MNDIKRGNRECYEGWKRVTIQFQKFKDFNNTCLHIHSIIMT
jgi:hypothetical protein